MAEVGKIQERQRAEAAAAAARGEVGDAKKEGAAAPAGKPDGKPEISIDEFSRLEFRVGRVVSCEAVPDSKKLLCSQVKIGDETKQIVSGIHRYYSPEEMVGKKVMVVCNLKPAKLAGLLSEGMLLCAEDRDGRLALMVPDPDREMPEGAQIR